jgi:hypothetical protein
MVVEVFLTLIVIKDVSAPFATGQILLCERVAVSGPDVVTGTTGSGVTAAAAIPTMSNNPMSNIRIVFIRITITLEKIIVRADI